MRKFYNGIAEINYVSFANWVSWKIKSISGLLNTNKGKSKNTFAAKTLLLLTGWHNTCL